MTLVNKALRNSHRRSLLSAKWPKRIESRTALFLQSLVIIVAYLSRAGKPGRTKPDTASGHLIAIDDYGMMMDGLVIFQIFDFN